VARATRCRRPASDGDRASPLGPAGVRADPIITPPPVSGRPSPAHLPLSILRRPDHASGPSRLAVDNRLPRRCECSCLSPDTAGPAPARGCTRSRLPPGRASRGPSRSGPGRCCGRPSPTNPSNAIRRWRPWVRPSTDGSKSTDRHGGRGSGTADRLRGEPSAYPGINAQARRSAATACRPRSRTGPASRRPSRTARTAFPAWPPTARSPSPRCRTRSRHAWRAPGRP
jgi:hypothetical protein